MPGIMANTEVTEINKIQTMFSKSSESKDNEKKILQVEKKKRLNEDFIVSKSGIFQEDSKLLFLFYLK